MPVETDDHANHAANPPPADSGPGGSARNDASQSPEAGHIFGTFRSRDGCTLHFRPIRGDDVEALTRLFLRLSPEEIRMRFQYSVSHLSPIAARRFCSPDPQNEAAFVLMDETVAPAEIRGVGRIYVDAVTRAAEFAVLVEQAWTGLGLGAFLMRRLIAECRRRELDEIWGLVLIENRPMLDLCKHLGFIRSTPRDDPGIALISLRLD